MNDLVVRTDNIQVTLSASRIIVIMLLTIFFMLLPRLLRLLKERIKKLIRKFKALDSAIYNLECPICLSTLEIPVRSDCGHAFCIECLYTFWREPSWKSICSICRAPLDNLHLVGAENKYTERERKALENKIDIISSDSIHQNNYSTTPMLTYATGIFLILLWVSASVHVDYLLQYSDEIYNSFYVSKKEIKINSDVIV